MSGYYTSERNVLILIALMKQHGVKRIIVSPGTTNITFVESVKSDCYFEVYSAPEERSAAYIACGLAAETKEPVALSCTGATASRNYIPGLTEAFYRKLPVIAITSSQHYGRIGNNHAQVIDRSQQLNDICEYSTRIYTIYSEEDEWDCNLKINIALMQLRTKGGGPVHIDLQTAYKNNYSVSVLPKQRVIRRISDTINFPKIMNDSVAVYVGSHLHWDSLLVSALEEFCEKYNGIVIKDHTSNYPGKYGVLINILTNQEDFFLKERKIELLIDIGEVSGAYIALQPVSTWRVCEDGTVKDRFHTLEYVFDCSEYSFFKYFNAIKKEKGKCSYFENVMTIVNNVRNNIPKVIPFSNVWIASQLSTALPAGSVVHLGILNSLRCWNYFEVDSSIRFYSNTGGFGIDGGLSSLIGASLASHTKLYFGIIGDLAFFYDMNSLGNKNIGKNLRILLINNGCGTEFRNYNHLAMNLDSPIDSGDYISAKGHYANKSKDLVKHYSIDLGFHYMTASNKDEFKSKLAEFVCLDIKRSIIFEVFTEPEDESTALYMMNHILAKPRSYSDKVKSKIKKIIGDNAIRQIKRITKKYDQV